MAGELSGRALNRQTRRAEYLEAALRLLMGGKLTMQALAREVGGAVGTAYTYFANRETLVAEVLEDLAKENKNKGIDAVRGHVSAFEPGNPALRMAILEIANGEDDKRAIEELILYGPY